MRDSSGIFFALSRPYSLDGQPSAPSTCAMASSAARGPRLQRCGHGYQNVLLLTCSSDSVPKTAQQILFVLFDYLPKELFTHSSQVFNLPTTGGIGVLFPRFVLKQQ